MPTSFTVCLTGGIASGKTTVSDLFKNIGVPVIDADVIARELVKPGSNLLSIIFREFGNGFRLNDGGLDRKKLRTEIFNAPASRRKLEDILHPPIIEALKAQVEAQTASYCIVVIPLLSETGIPDFIDRILVVDTEPSSQTERLMKRDNISEEQALAILNSQAKREERLKIADDVISNDSTLTALQEQVHSLHAAYSRISTTKNYENK